MKRVAFKMHLKAGQEKEYTRRHNAIWPELSALLKTAGIAEYSIFFDAETNTLFGVQQLTGEQGSQDLADNPIVKQWWAYMADIMEVNEDDSPTSTPLQEVFYLP